MKLYFRKLLIMCSVVLLSVALFIYVSFSGFPWKKYTVGKEIQAYLDERYDQPFLIKDRLYNFKDGKYGIKATPVKEADLQFTAWEGYGDYEYIDYYPEAVWEKQVYDDFEEIVNKIYPDHTMYNASTAMGFGNELVKGPEIPSYRDVDVLTSIAISTRGSVVGNDSEFARMLAILSEIKKAEANIEVSFHYYRTTEQKIEYLHFDRTIINKITTIEDVKKMARMSVWVNN
ncbi:hypothetical protein P9E76_03590 [Schinkia azotoformans]|uniref:YfjL-like N-terminal domain-containing protein n=1 Tax=Schinkia azotoformans LMG 9581 TaxID=1131731 RepID=K6D611_SCHAZ|nr:hypothetical protein [Schinkia azotoformans]EKN63744.1 hypothetical protein BAZO_16114 [Schinkia azotoformans LMG 9581]MEC1640957.1 hypothetical protein [Schinkia azotoformans]MEC1944152.1 hypothetical protein [Schinkia azotoformans]